MDLKNDVFNHVVPLQIRFNDIDRLGHVNNAVVQEFFDLGRITYFNDTLGDLLGKEDQQLVIVSYKTDFYRQIMPNDKVEVRTKIHKLGNKSIRMWQWIAVVGEDTPKAINDSVLSGFYAGTDKSMVIPEEWRHIFDEFEKGTLIPDKDR
ncbi:MAG TPA: acyl-CoA thioesterase [Treponema sp.]|nr:acyl-CoA thioesterase [Treponema sp.]